MNVKALSLQFDEAEVIRQLERLPAERRAIFAAACAQRLLPAYVRFSSRTGKGDPATLEGILVHLWNDLLGDPMPDAELKDEIDVCLELIPQEDDEGPWVNEQAGAEDAAAALAYALQCRQKGHSQEAAWAARRAYEALDHYVINSENVNLNGPGAEKFVLSHPLVQAELLRQSRDIEELAAGSQDPAGLIARCRDRAKTEGAIFFGSMP